MSRAYSESKTLSWSHPSHPCPSILPTNMALRLAPRALTRPPPGLSTLTPLLAASFNPARSTRAASTSIPTPSPPSPALQPSESSPPDLQQSPNYAATWSTSQAPKPAVYADVRFTQTRRDMQPAAPSAMEMVSRDPVRLVTARRATCDGGEFF